MLSSGNLNPILLVKSIKLFNTNRVTNKLSSKMFIFLLINL